MKLLRLELGGFTCFREPTCVNFDDLELFAICGPTGAGKTSLLDAVTYALYGRTARLGGRGLGALISPGADKMSVSLEFSVGQTDPVRVTRVSVRRGETLENQPRLERFEAGGWRLLAETTISEVNRRLVQLVGLDYDGFTRAVLLPQGEFGEFLRGDAGERRRLLVRLLGLERVQQMQGEASGRAQQLKSRREHIQVQLMSDYADATPERVAQLETDIAALSDQLERLNGERQQLERSLTELAELKALVSEQAAQRAKLAELDAQREAIAHDQRVLEQARAAKLTLPHLEYLDGRQRALGTVCAEQRKHDGVVKGLERQASDAEGSLRDAETAAAAIPELDAHLHRLSAVTPLVAQLKARKGTLELAAYASLDTPYSDDAWEQHAALSSQLPALKQAQQGLKQAEADRTQAEAALSQTRHREAVLGQQLEALHASGLQAKTRHEAAKTAYEQAVLGNQVGALRPHLHVGEPCPVCAQPVATLPPAATGAGDLDRLKAAQREAETALLTCREDYTAARSERKGMHEQLAAQQDALVRAEQVVDQRRTHLTEVGSTFATFGSGDPATLDKTLEKALETRRRTLLGGLAKTIAEATGGLDPERATSELKRQRKRLEDTLKTAQGAHHQAATLLSNAHTKTALLEQQHVERRQEVEGAQQQLADALAQTGFADADEAKQASRSDAAMTGLEATINQHHQARRGAEQQVVALTEKLAGRPYDAAQHEALIARQGVLARELSDSHKALGGKQQAHGEVRSKIERAEALRAEALRLEAEHTTYYQLNLDLRSDAFPEYLLTRVQADLARRASQIVREVTQGRYDLCLENNDFHVLDAWHTGELRSVKTLSGGETFIASLALALALSETIAGNTVLGSLFLDEGFGTLDRETLDAVAQVLEALSTEGRLVGIITHVTALSERLPARLQVSKGPSGSTVAWDV